MVGSIGLVSNKVKVNSEKARRARRDCAVKIIVLLYACVC